MPPSNDEARTELQALLKREDRDPAWVARRIGKSYLWVWRRLAGETPMKMDDYRLIHGLSAETCGWNPDLAA